MKKQKETKLNSFADLVILKGTGESGQKPPLIGPSEKKELSKFRTIKLKSGFNFTYRTDSPFNESK